LRFFFSHKISITRLFNGFYILQQEAPKNCQVTVKIEDDKKKSSIFYDLFIRKLLWELKKGRQWLLVGEGHL
jgi:hypothetical protein